MKLSEKTFNVISLLGVVAMLVLALLDWYIPRPKEKMTEHQKTQAILQLKRGVAKQDDALKAAKASVARYVWPNNTDAIASQSLKLVTALAAKHRVQLLGFRPQKASDEGDGFTHMPYLILLNGSFPNVEATLQDIEQPANKLAVSLVQYASSDANSDSVNATIGVIAYTLTGGTSSATTTK